MINNENIIYGTIDWNYKPDISKSIANLEDNLPKGPYLTWGAWQCGYCRMINSGKELNCEYCGAFGELNP